MAQLVRLEKEGAIVILWRLDEELEWFMSRMQLAEAEKLSLSAIKTDKRKREWIASRYMIHHELGDNVSTCYVDDVPCLIGSDLCISISHSGNIVGVMLSEYPCGIDIEDSRRDFTRVATRFLSKQERDIIDESKYGVAWCVKEAAYKLIGDKNIDFANMFIIKNIDIEKERVLMRYNDTNYEFDYFILDHHIITYSV